jgi:hypothetical protein
MTESTQTTTDEGRTKRRKKPYEAPRILLREELEAGAFICQGQTDIGKTNTVTCPTFIGS